jgi:membrane-bound inhibitor of C-type lysozyme
MMSTRTIRLAAACLALAAPLALAGGAGAADIINDVTFNCEAGKSIHAVFYPESVGLILSDGRALSLPQTISGSGARYANADESIVFWNKGNTAFITEGSDGATTYGNCVVEGQ